MSYLQSIDFEVQLRDSCPPCQKYILIWLDTATKSHNNAQETNPAMGEMMCWLADRLARHQSLDPILINQMDATQKPHCQVEFKHTGVNLV